MKITTLKLYDCRQKRAFREALKKVRVRVLGCDRVLSPLDQTWDSFFLADDDKIFASNAANKVFKRKGSPLNDKEPQLAWRRLRDILKDEA